MAPSSSLSASSFSSSFSSSSSSSSSSRSSSSSSNSMRLLRVLVVAAAACVCVVRGGPVVFAGLSTGPGLLGAASVASWDGSTWSTPFNPLSVGVVSAITIYGRAIFVGGRFAAPVANGTDIANGLVLWEPGQGGAWIDPFGLTTSAMLTGAHVHALAVVGGLLYYAGDFTLTALPTNIVNIGTFDGRTALPLPGTAGVDDAVYTLLPDDAGGLYIGGLFTSAGGLTANAIVYFGNNEYTPLSTGMDGPVHTLAMFYGDVYAAGDFTTAGGVPANNIARWNGVVWNLVGSGTNGIVLALGVFNGDLYAGGTFTSAGGIDVSNVAQWTGSGWAAAGPGLNGSVRAMTLYAYYLWAGGAFLASNTTATPFASVWGFYKWSPLGTGPGAPVSAFYSGCDIGEVYPSCLTPGAIAGIVVGVVFGTALILLACGFGSDARRYRRAHKDATQPERHEKELLALGAISPSETAAPLA